MTPTIGELAALPRSELVRRLVEAIDRAERAEWDRDWAVKSRVEAMTLLTMAQAEIARLREGRTL